MFSFNNGEIISSKLLNKKKSPKVAIIMDTFFSFPPITGFNYRMYHLTKHLQKNNVEVIWILPNRGISSNKQIQNLKSTEIPMYILPVDLFYDKYELVKIIKANKITVIQFESAQTFIELGICLKQIMSIPVLLEFHDIESTLRETISAKESVETLEYIQYIASIIADHIICFTELDKKHLTNKLCVPSDKITLIPNGINSEDFTLYEDIEKNRSLVFVGNLFYKPNKESLEYFLNDILPLIHDEYPDLEVKIIGMTPKEIVSKYQKISYIKFLGVINNNEIYMKELQSSLIGLSIVLSGSGMNIKNLSYAGAGLAVLTTNLGANGYECLSNLNIVKPSIYHITKELTNLLSNQKNTVKTGQKLRDETLICYNWLDISKKHISVLETISLFDNKDINYKTHKDFRPLWLQEKRVQDSDVKTIIKVNV